ncbi:sensor histidine kinase [Ktedonospora formicarum]|uniref:histidine kinase n=1 Tax=Ktedonospora formicarum TaxID=2778364 RepID=A0A8J3HYT9_9CHLR|nr:HAMP domain-containing sensor histidine kinase [Ktedonospora formicarum]GHO46244.1 hypothetical protein KSX_44070 [Ktedonospora formicarum]
MTIASDRLTNVYTKGLQRGKYVALAILICMTLASILGFFFHVAEDRYPDLVSNIMYPLASGLGSTWGFLTAYRAYRGPLRLGKAYVLAWLLIGMGLMSNCLGGLYYTYAEWTGQSLLSPSWSDIGFTCVYPLTFLGLLIMPSTSHFRLRLALDAVIATLSILGVSWFFFISKVFFIQIKSGVSTSELVTAVSYPFWDMLLIFAIILLVYRRTTSLFLPSLVLLGVGVISNIWADTGYAYTLAIGTYDAVKFFIDPFWYLGFMLIGLSGIYQYAAICRHACDNKDSSSAQARIEPLLRFLRTQEANQELWQLVQNLLVYLPLGILLVLTFYSGVQEYAFNENSSLVLIGLTSVVGLLVTLRSLIAMSENRKLVQALSQAKIEQEAVASEQARLFAELRQTHERLQELDKLKDQFMITASHELRTPLTSIQGYLELLMTYGETTPKQQQRDFILKALRGSEELAFLLNNVMDASRLEIDAGIRPIHLEPVEVLEAVKNVITLIEPQILHEQRKLEICVPTSLIVQAEPTRLRQVLLNLATNAVKYSPPGSPIIFSARVENNLFATVSVTDLGSGIPLEEQGRLFQRFVRLERDVNSVIRGSGLGLYISRRLVEAMGGMVWVESSGVQGEGSSFKVQLHLVR